MSYESGRNHAHLSSRIVICNTKPQLAIEWSKVVVRLVVAGQITGFVLCLYGVLVQYFYAELLPDTMKPDESCMRQPLRRFYAVYLTLLGIAIVPVVLSLRSLYSESVRIAGITIGAVICRVTAHAAVLFRFRPCPLVRFFPLTMVCHGLQLFSVIWYYECLRRMRNRIALHMTMPSPDWITTKPKTSASADREVEVVPFP